MRNSEDGGEKDEGEKTPGGQDTARMDLLQKLLTLKRLVDSAHLRIRHLG